MMTTSAFVSAVLQIAESDNLPPWTYEWTYDGLRTIVSRMDLERRFGLMGKSQAQAIRLEIFERLVDGDKAKIKL